MKIFKNLFKIKALEVIRHRQTNKKEVSLAQQYYNDARIAFEQDNYREALKLLMFAFNVDPDFKPDCENNILSSKDFKSWIDKKAS